MPHGFESHADRESSGGRRYSPLEEITPANVERLEVAWTYRTGDVSDGRGDVPSTSAFQATPILADGTLYLCHRFAGDGHFAVGHVAGGIDREAITSLLGRLRAASSACLNCWARDLCGGPCHHDLETMPEESVGYDAVRCSVRRRIIELSMWLYAELPEELRRHLRGRSRGEAHREGKVEDRPRVKGSGEAMVRGRG